MAHMYVMENGHARRYEQLTKKGEVSKRINKKRAAEDGAVLGCTDTLKVLGDTGGLLVWKGNLGIKAGQEFPSDLQKAKERLEWLSTEAAFRGTEIHDYIDQYLTKGLVPDDEQGLVSCLEVKRWLDEQGVNDFQCEHCFVWRGWINITNGNYAERMQQSSLCEAEHLGYIKVETGGTSDFVSDGLTCDWKTVEDKGYGFRGSYAKEAAQMAMYRLGFGKHKARCVNLYVDRTTGRIVRVKEWTEAELMDGLRLFAMASLYTDIAERLEA